MHQGVAVASGLVGIIVAVAIAICIGAATSSAGQIESLAWVSGQQLAAASPGLDLWCQAQGHSASNCSGAEMEYSLAGSHGLARVLARRRGGVTEIDVRLIVNLRTGCLPGMRASACAGCSTAADLLMATAFMGLVTALVAAVGCAAQWRVCSEVGLYWRRRRLRAFVMGVAALGTLMSLIMLVGYSSQCAGKLEGAAAGSGTGLGVCLLLLWVAVLAVEGCSAPYEQATSVLPMSWGGDAKLRRRSSIASVNSAGAGSVTSLRPKAPLALGKQDEPEALLPSYELSGDHEGGTGLVFAPPQQRRDTSEDILALDPFAATTPLVLKPPARPDTAESAPSFASLDDEAELPEIKPREGAFVPPPRSGLDAVVAPFARPNPAPPKGSPSLARRPLPLPMRPPNIARGGATDGPRPSK